jgi:hypothetical protein
MRYALLLLFLPMWMACPRPTPPGPSAPEDGLPSEVRDTMPFDAARVKRYRATLGLLDLDRLDAVGEAWQEYLKVFEGTAPKTADHGFGAFLSYQEKNLRNADRRAAQVYGYLLPAVRAGRPVDFEKDETTRQLYRNLCTLRLTGESALSVRPDWAALSAKAQGTVSDTVRTLLEQLDREDGELEKAFWTQPQALTPATTAAHFDFWVGIHYDVSPEFPLRALVRERYLGWLNRLLPAFPVGRDVSDHEGAWRSIAEYWAESPEGAEFAELLRMAGEAGWSWNESLQSTRNLMLRQLPRQ